MADGCVHPHVGSRDPVRDGVLHGLVRDHFAAFVERVQEDGRSLPCYVVAEFEAFLRCGGSRASSCERGARGAGSTGWWRSRASTGACVRAAAVGA